MAALNAFSGIPLSSLVGFRAPLLDFTADTLRHLADADFLYDSSATAATPADRDGTDAFWPYTLDNGASGAGHRVEEGVETDVEPRTGLANNCLDVDGVCRGQLKLPGLWEIPMYATFQNDNPARIHLMVSRFPSAVLLHHSPAPAF